MVQDYKYEYLELDTEPSTFTEDQFTSHHRLRMQADFPEYRSSMKQQENCPEKGAIKWMAKIMTVYSQAYKILQIYVR